MLSMIVVAVAWGQAAPAGALGPSDILAELSLEELMNIEVVSVSKKEEKLSEAAAAVFVLTAEDIRRFGCTSLPEALRMVPGLEVARIDANKWAVSARGFNGRFANKVLVLVDGRGVYSSMYSGVFWEAQDVFLQDLDRIEVIRGPGATLWGANAVNGVINIITRSAGQTQGLYASLGGGSEERRLGEIRYGGELGVATHYRAYAKYFDRDHAADASGQDAADEWRAARGGFRVDWASSPHDVLTLSGDLYDGEAGQTITVYSLESPYADTHDDRVRLTGGHVMGRWERAFSGASDMAVQTYHERAKRQDPIIELVRSTSEVDVQHRFSAGWRQEIVWGLGCRYTDYEIQNTFSVAFPPGSPGEHLWSGFVQDEIALSPDRLHLILGSKFEHHNYTGPQILPNARVVWTPGEKHTVWAAVSKAARTPSRAENEAIYVVQAFPPDKFVPGMPAVVTIEGHEEFESEELLAYEVGGRVRPNPRLSLDLAAFYNVYDHLRTIEQGTPFFKASPTPVHLVIPLYADNLMEGQTYGLEVTADWQAREWWRLHASCTYLQMRLRLDPRSMDTSSRAAEGESPHYQVLVRSMMAVSEDLTLDLASRYVDQLPSLNVDRYTSLDIRLGWRLTEAVHLDLVGQNLLQTRHPEFTPEFYDTLPTHVERGVYGKVTWQY